MSNKQAMMFDDAAESCAILDDSQWFSDVGPCINLEAGKEMGQVNGFNSSIRHQNCMNEFCEYFFFSIKQRLPGDERSSLSEQVARRGLARTFKRTKQSLWRGARKLGRSNSYQSRWRCQKIHHGHLHANKIYLESIYLDTYLSCPLPFKIMEQMMLRETLNSMASWKRSMPAGILSGVQYAIIVRLQ